MRACVHRVLGLATAFLMVSAVCTATEPPSKPADAPRRNVAIFLFTGVELLDFAGPAEVFQASGRPFNVYTVAASVEPITSQGFVKVVPQYSIENCPKPDLLVIPGGATTATQNNPEVIAWVKRVSGEAELTMSVCTGAFILAKAGLLDGQEATTHWFHLTRLGKAAPNIQVRSKVRFVDSGRVVTTAGVSAGIDGALHVVERLIGREAAERTAHGMEYHWDAKREPGEPGK